VKISAFYVQPFWSYSQKSENLTHLPEKQLSKNKETRSARDVPTTKTLLLHIFRLNF